MSDASGSRRAKAEEGPVKRELETAPLLLRKASIVLLCGAVLPWMTAISTLGADGDGAMPWGAWAIGVALTVASGLVFIESAKHASGLKANGLVTPVAGAHPLAGPILGGLLFLGGVVNSFAAGVEGMGFYAALELGTLLLALGTLAHILRYEYGGKFNPIFPLMFAGPAVAGALQALKAGTRMGESPLVIVSLLGSLGVAAGGIYAMYTMFVSMKQAKIEGDIKKAQERERKKAERAARRAQQQ